MQSLPFDCAIVHCTDYDGQCFNSIQVAFPFALWPSVWLLYLRWDLQAPLLYPQWYNMTVQISSRLNIILEFLHVTGVVDISKGHHSFSCLSPIKVRSGYLVFSCFLPYSFTSVVTSQSNRFCHALVRDVIYVLVFAHNRKSCVKSCWSHWWYWLHVLAVFHGFGLSNKNHALLPFLFITGTRLTRCLVHVCAYAI